MATAAKKKLTTTQKLKSTIQALNKKHGDCTIFKGKVAAQVEAIPTGIATLDHILGIGGLPRGRIIEIYGLESCGKTTTILQVIAHVQKTYFADKKRYGVAALIDAEHAIDPSWAVNCGVDWDGLVFSQPDTGEIAFDIAVELAKSGEVDLIVFDSVAAMISKTELEGDVGDASIGSQARMMSQGMRIIKGELRKNNTTAIFINQIRQKIGVKFGNPETTTGGLALKFYSSVRMEIKKASQVKEGGAVGKDAYEGAASAKESIGIRSKIKIIKNKVAPPFRSCEYNIMWGQPPVDGAEIVYGVDEIGCLFDMALELKLITLKGSNYYRPVVGKEDPVVLGAGKLKARIALQADPDLQKLLRDMMIAEVQKDLRDMDADDAVDAILGDQIEDDEADGDEDEESTGETSDGDSAEQSTEV